MTDEPTAAVSGSRPAPDPERLHAAVALAEGEAGLAVVSLARADATIHSSLVNVGLLDQPLTGEPCLAFVTAGAVKLANLRVRPQITATFRQGWQWAAVEGTAEIIGPHDPHGAFDAERLRVLLRAIFSAAGGRHDDWDDYDATMVEQARAAVLIRPTRILSN